MEIGAELGAVVFEADAAVSLELPPFAVTTSTTSPATTTTAPTVTPTPTILRRRARSARRTSCRSSLRLAASRRCWLVGTCPSRNLVDVTDRVAAVYGHSL